MTHSHSHTPWWRTWSGISMIGALAVTALYLSTAHADHVLRALPFLALLLCPLMHLFMHRGHGSHGNGHPGEGHRHGPAMPAPAETSRRHRLPRQGPLSHPSSVSRTDA